VNVVEEMAIASGLPKPKVWVVPDDDPNAFATGRDATTASIAVTEGLLGKLTRDELQAVVAHEMAHIRNLDVRLMTLLAGMVGAIALMSDGMGRMMGRGSRAGGRWAGGRLGGGKGGKGGNPLGLIILVLWLLTLIVAPVVSRLLAMTVSRKREYLADATGAQLTRNPMALASALEKLDGATAATRAITHGAAHLCIVDPAPSVMSSKEGFLADVFASHPPIRQRIIRLRGMAYQQAKREPAASISPQ
jgi:heat shock protein HtpX